MKRFAGALALALLLPWIGRAEEPAPTKFYTLNFVVQEIDGSKVVNSREYSTISAAGSAMDCSIRTNSQVPVQGSQVSPGHFQALDVGVSIDVSHLSEADTNISLTVKASLSSLPAGDGVDPMGVVRRNSWSATVMIPIKKRTVIFSSDDVSSKHKMQLVLTATPIK